MSSRIVKRNLGVAFVKGLQSSQQEGVEYRLSPLPGVEVVPPPLVRMIPAASLLRECGAIRDSIAAMNACASRREPRGVLDLEAAIDSLGKRVLPDTGLAELLASGGEPWFAIHDRYASELPWEAFRETYRHCANNRCARFRKPLAKEEATRAEPGYCGACSKRLRLRSHQLGIGRHLAHYVYSAEATPPPTGRRFLIVADPTEDLFDPRLDPDGVCSQHVMQLAGLLQDAGYEVDLQCGSGATVDAFLAALRDPELCGLYYFGHGVHGDGAPEGALLLHGRQALLAAEIERERPRLRFAFINACHGAAVGKDWGLDKPVRSVAHALGQGGQGKVVIAPIWPVISVQAARAALDFFRAAVRKHCLSQCLQWARRRSYREYKRGQPDVAWASYRYFGDPERKLPEPMHPSPAATPGTCRLFDADGRLRAELFSFPIDELLLRAAKRRNFQNRLQFSPSDLLAGLLRRGELTRFALRAQQADPDLLYERLVEAAERGELAATAGAAAGGVAPSDEERWIIHSRKAFRADALEILRLADEAAQRPPGAGLIAELHLLRAMCGTTGWTSNPCITLPSAAKTLELVEGNERRRQLDDNGRILLADLSPGARKVVEKAHALAQMCGTSPITARLLLTAFLLEECGVAAKMARAQQVDPEGLAAVLLALSDPQPSRTFALGADAASRIVSPMLLRAREMAAESGTVDETQLLRGFCQAAPIEFKRLLEALPSPWNLRLDDLFGGSEPPPPEPPRQGEAPFPPGGVPLGGGEGQSGRRGLSMDDLDDEVQRLLAMAGHWARLQWSPEVRSPHLFAALVADGKGAVGIMLRRAGVDHELGKISILAMVPLPAQPATAHPETLGLSASVLRTLTAARDAARKNGRRQCGLDDVLDAFFTDGGGPVGERLRQLGVDTQLWKRRHWDEGSRRNGNGHKH